MIYEGWNGVGFRKTNRHSNHRLQYTKVGMRLVFAKATVIPTMGYDIRKLERGCFSQHQPPFQPCTPISEGWNAVDFRKTNRHSNHGLWYTKVVTGLVFAKPTAIPTMGFTIPRLERGWFSQKQPSFQPLTSRYESWNGVGFRKTSRHSNLWLKYTKVGTRLVFANPTVDPTVAAHVWGLENGWFSSIQLSFQTCALRYVGWNAVGFRKSNCQSNRCRSCMRVGKGLVSVNPTAFLPCASRYEGWNAVGFRKTNRQSNRGL